MSTEMYNEIELDNDLIDAFEADQDGDDILDNNFDGSMDQSNKWSTSKVRLKYQSRPYPEDVIHLFLDTRR